jgi:hypothetical protein
MDRRLSVASVLRSVARCVSGGAKGGQKAKSVEQRHRPTRAMLLLPSYTCTVVPGTIGANGAPTCTTVYVVRIPWYTWTYTCTYTCGVPYQYGMVGTSTGVPWSAPWYCIPLRPLRPSSGRRSMQVLVRVQAHMLWWRSALHTSLSSWNRSIPRYCDVFYADNAPEFPRYLASYASCFVFQVVFLR